MTLLSFICIDITSTDFPLAAMTFENMVSTVNSPSLNDDRREEKPLRKRNTIMSSFDMMYSESTLAAIATCNSSTSGASTDVVTGENIRMITDLGKLKNIFFPVNLVKWMS